ncbi:hypothetical protein [Flavobacterium sp. N1994]|uniref:hypothetical protein n=1 Tax=Flavobacterium sp. N1994 TaxID=2986827 RepID=UPI002222B93B|nr:hypothetical protein [Flavobacterium sp. N1994]
MESQDKKRDHIDWYIFIGCMFIGMGIGEAFDSGGVGTMVGMGVGFLASALYKGEKSK